MTHQFIYLVCARVVVTHMVPRCNEEESWCERLKVRGENCSNLVSGSVQKSWVCALPVVDKASVGRPCVHIRPVRREENSTARDG